MMGTKPEPHLLDSPLFMDDFELLPTQVQLDLICCFGSYAAGLPDRQQPNQQLRERAVIMLTVMSAILREHGPFLVEGLKALSVLLGSPFVRSLAKKRPSLLALLATLLRYEASLLVRRSTLSALRLFFLEVHGDVCNEVTRMVLAVAKASLKEENQDLKTDMMRSLSDLREALLKFPLVKNNARILLTDHDGKELLDVSANVLFHFLRADRNPSKDDLSFGVLLLSNQH